MKKIFFITTLFLNSIFIDVIKAQESTGVNFSNGDVICANDLESLGSLLRKSQQSYDTFIIGVFQKSEIKNPQFSKNPVIHEGICSVKYNSENGPIKKGDLVTSSSTSGIAMKATKSGIIIGVALEDAPSSSGLLKIRILVQYVKQ